MHNKEELLILVDQKNHRIVFDGFEHIWESKLSGTWKPKYIKPFDEMKKAESFMLYGIATWKKDLKRILDLESKELEENYKKILRKKKSDLKRVVKISNSSMKGYKKVELVLQTVDALDNKTIAKTLGISIRSFYNYIDLLKKNKKKFAQ